MLAPGRAPWRYPGSVAPTEPDPGWGRTPGQPAPCQMVSLLNDAPTPGPAPETQLARNSELTIRTLRLRKRGMKNSTKSRTGQTEWLNSHGQPHRLGAPAIITDGGTKFWFVNGLLHREDGPAVEYANGRTEFWLNGLPRKVLERSVPNPFGWVGGLLSGLFEVLNRLR